MGSRKQEQRFREIEQSQAMLREEIAQSKRLIDDSHRLIEQNRQELRPIQAR